MENTDRIVPEINFEYWYGVNQKSNSTRHRGVITTIVNNINQNNTHISDFIEINKGLILPYFIGDTYEIEKLRNLDYNALEKLILCNIEEFDVKKSSNQDLLKIFDLIQIWGGGAIQGGGGPYRIIQNGLPIIPSRLNYNAWINNYKNCVEQASRGEIEAYVNIIQIPQLGLAFGSKHVSFWSRKNNVANNCLVVIDKKIAGVCGLHEPDITLFPKINNDIQHYSSKYKLEPYKIEKALFSFYSYYFDNNNYNIIESRRGETNQEDAIKIADKLNRNENKKNKIPKDIVLKKSEYLIITNKIFISEICVKGKKLNNYVDNNDYANVNGKVYYKFKGESSGIKFL